MVTATQSEVIWNTDAPLIPGVYRVKYKDHTGVFETEPVNGWKFYAYWDGVDTWSYALNFSVYDARRARMMKPGIMHEWTGKVR